MEEAIRIAERTDEHAFEAELHRLHGELLIQSDQAEVVEPEFRRALSIAREQHAKMWELRAAISLARLWSENGRRSEARELVAPIYDWFTEGFETTDLKQAKTLLETLE